MIIEMFKSKENFCVFAAEAMAWLSETDDAQGVFVDSSVELPYTSDEYAKYCFNEGTEDFRDDIKFISVVYGLRPAALELDFEEFSKEVISYMAKNLLAEIMEYGSEYSVVKCPIFPDDTEGIYSEIGHDNYWITACLMYDKEQECEIVSISTTLKKDK